MAGITGLVASGGNVHDPALQGKAFGHVGLAAIFTLVFGILAVAGEYSAAPSPTPSSAFRGAAG